MAPKPHCNFKQPKIGHCVCHNADFLRTMCKTKSDIKCRRIIRKAGTDQLLAVAEICLNIVKSRFHLTTRQKKRLLPYADFVRRMSRARSERGARQILVQKGNGLPAVLAAIFTPILLELGRKMIKGDPTPIE